jgi:WD40 repeat protein
MNQRGDTLRVNELGCFAFGQGNKLRFCGLKQKELRTLNPGHTDAITGVTFDQSGSTIVSVDASGKVLAYGPEAKTPQVLVKSTKDEAAVVKACALSRDGRTLILGQTWGTLQVFSKNADDAKWNRVKTPKTPKTFEYCKEDTKDDVDYPLDFHPAPAYGVRGISLSSDGNVAVVWYDDDLALARILKRKPDGSWFIQVVSEGCIGVSTVQTAAISSNGKLIALGGDDGLIYIIDVSGATPVPKGYLYSDAYSHARAHRGEVVSLEFLFPVETPGVDESQFLVSGGSCGGSRLWDLDKNLRKTIE